MTQDSLAALHEQLVDMRLSLVERLAERMDGGQLALLGSYQIPLIRTGVPNRADRST
jgi:hypothetical protein